MFKLVEGRACGECTICCKWLTIRPLAKPAGILCRHCAEGAGCTIYADRPEVCQTWHCAWRMIATLDDSWRPDRSRILVEFVADDIPATYGGRPGLKFTLLGDPAEAIRTTGLVDTMARYIAGGVAVFLGLPGEPGHQFARTLLNNGLLPAIRAGNRPAVVAAIGQAVEALKVAEKPPVVV